MKKSNFQTVIFATSFVTMNGHTYKLHVFKIYFMMFKPLNTNRINTELNTRYKVLDCITGLTLIDNIGTEYHIYL